MPKEPKPGDVEYLQLCGQAVEHLLPDNHGFVIITFQFGTPNAKVRYCSNANRRGVMAALKGLINHVEKNWNTHESEEN